MVLRRTFDIPRKYATGLDGLLLSERRALEREMFSVRGKNADDVLQAFSWIVNPGCRTHSDVDFSAFYRVVTGEYSFVSGHVRFKGPVPIEDYGGDAGYSGLRCAPSPHDGLVGHTGGESNAKYGEIDGRFDLLSMSLRFGME